MREVWMILHRWSGLFMVLFLTIAAITGCLLVFRGPLDRALNPDLWTLPALTAATGPDRALTAVETYARANPLVQVVQFPLNVPAGRTLPVQVAARPGAPDPATDQVFLDPRDGSVVGARAGGPGWDARHLVAGISELHFTLLAGDWGRWLLGALAVVWLLSSCIGAWLTWPTRQPRWTQWKRTWQLRRASALPRLLLDLHRASGLWLFPFLLILAFTSAALNFFGEAWEPFATTVSPLKRSLFDQEAPTPKVHHRLSALLTDWPPPRRRRRARGSNGSQRRCSTCPNGTFTGSSSLMTACSITAISARSIIISMVPAMRSATRSIPTTTAPDWS